MKKRVQSIVIIFAMVLALFGGAIAIHATPTEVFTDDFSETSLSGKYTVVGNTASVVDGKLVIDSTATDFGGALITAQKVDAFVLEFDLNNACTGVNTFSVITGIQDRTALTLADWAASSVVFGTTDSMCVNNSSGTWQRYSWYNVTVGSDVRVRITVDTGVFSIEYKAADATEWTAIADHAGGAVSLQPTSGYIALAINGAGKATVDNISLTAEYAPEDPLPTEPETTEPETTEPETTEPETTQPETEPEATVPAGEFYWEDNFDGRTELGDNYLANLAEGVGSITVEGGKLKFSKIADATGLYIKTQAVGNKFTVSFDLNMQEGSSPVAFLFGIDAPEQAVMYWDSSINRFSIAMDAYRLGCAGAELPYIPGSGTDTDAAVAYQAAWFQTHCTAVNKAEDEYLNIRLVFDVVDGKNTLTVYYKLNTEDASVLETPRVTWSDVDAAGYIGIVSQGSAADFTIDNLVITDRDETEEEGGPSPSTGDSFYMLPAVMLVASLTAIIALPRRRNEK